MYLRPFELCYDLLCAKMIVNDCNENNETMLGTIEYKNWTPLFTTRWYVIEQLHKISVAVIDLFSSSMRSHCGHCILIIFMTSIQVRLFSLHLSVYHSYSLWKWPLGHNKTLWWYRSLLALTLASKRHKWSTRIPVNDWHKYHLRCCIDSLTDKLVYFKN